MPKYLDPLLCGGHCVHIKPFQSAEGEGGSVEADSNGLCLHSDNVGATAGGGDGGHVSWAKIEP